VNVRSCVFGCVDANDVPFRAAPGRLACNTCSSALWTVLADVEKTYGWLTDIDNLIPGGTGDGAGARAVPGPRSPAVDALLALMDTRTAGSESPGALGAVEQWARRVREDLSVDTAPDRMRSTVPPGRVTMRRELATIRFQWDWVCAQDWVTDFDEKMRALLGRMETVGHLKLKELRIGTCPTPQMTIPAADGSTITLLCSARLKVRVGDSEIRCKSCGTVWTRDRWHKLGNPWTDYASLSTELDVPVGTLRRWCSLDRWQVDGTRGRRLVLRADALDSYAKHRTPKPLEAAG
jgi:hypothetical protein